MRVDLSLPLAGASLYQEVVDNAQAATGARFVHIAWFDVERGEVRAGAMAGLGSEFASRTFAAIRRLFPEFDPSSIRFPVDVNRFNQRVFLDGEPVEALLTEIAAGAVHPQVLHLVETIAGMRYCFSCPLKVGSQVVGALAFHSAVPLDETNRRTCEAFARQTALTLENARLVETVRTQFDALQASEQRFRLLAENSSDVIFRVRLEPAIAFEYISPAVASLTGYTAEELYLEPSLAETLLFEEEREILPRIRESAQTLAEPLTLRLHHRDGSTRWVELKLTRVYQSDRLVALEGVARDVTERTLGEEQVLRAQRLETLGQIAGQIAHDFNNLLGPLVGYPELIRMQLPEGHPAIAWCDAMMRAAANMALVNQDLMALGRRGHADQEPTDLNQVIRQVLDDMAPPPAQLHVELDLAKDLLPTIGSGLQLVRAITNLVANAREAVHDGGRIVIRTENVYLDKPSGRFSRVSVGEYVRLEIADTGAGIPAENLDKIFDPFFTTKRVDRRRGSGLGLSIVQSIVEDHHGTIDVRTEVNRGTTFSIYLPICREMPDEPPKEIRGGDESILIVDDDQLQRDVARRLLETLGYRVSAAASGEEAVALLEKQSVDLLVLDMIMPPGIDGAEAYRRIVAIRPDQRAIIVSGFAETERVVEAQRLGAGAYVRKPVRLADLATAVRTELERKR